MPNAFDKLISAVQGLTSAVKDNTRAAKRSGGAGGGAAAGGGLLGGGVAPGGAGKARAGSKGAGGLGGRLGNLAGLAKAAGPLALAAGAGAVAGTALNAVGQGVISSARGGDFGSGVARSLVNVAAKIPFIGEFTGASEAVRVLEGAEGDLNAATGQAARLLGPGAISDAARGFVARRQVTENTNLELDRQANANAIQDAQGGVFSFFASRSGLGQAYLHQLNAGGAQANQ